jgi:hypothetical protein
MTATAKIVIPLMLSAGLPAGACSSGARHATVIDKQNTTVTTSPLLHPAPRPGVLLGQLIMEGGPPHGDNPRPIPGSVRLIQHGRVVATAQAGADGRFSRTLGPGTYQVQACTSKIQEVYPNGSLASTCGLIVQAQVVTNHTTTVDIPDFIVP